MFEIIMQILKLKMVYDLISLYSLNGICVAFVIWYTIRAVTRFTERPQGTVISMKNSADLPFPAITICPNFGKFTKKSHFKYGRETNLVFNKTYLEKICGIR